ncbi:MAG: hypothetical protein ACREJC_16545, partial [Tepidisphaeraceae bacterium]
TSPTVVVSDVRSINSVFSEESLSVTGSGRLTLGASGKFMSVGISSGGLLNVTAGGDKTVRTTLLSIAGTGKLDLFDNDLLVDYTGATPLATIQSLINSARNFGAWDGSGITSSSALNNPDGITTLGAMEASDYQSVHGPSATFDGHTLDSTVVLVKYTYFGDADFNGVVNLDDYSLVDGGYLMNLTGWLNGDFDGLGGKPDLDDYSLIDAAFLTQGSPL